MDKDIVERLGDLERLAKAADQPDWRVSGGEGHERHINHAKGQRYILADDGNFIICETTRGWKESVATAEFIAAASPKNVLAALRQARNEGIEEMIAWHRKKMDWDSISPEAWHAHHDSIEHLRSLKDKQHD